MFLSGDGLCTRTMHSKNFRSKEPFEFCRSLFVLFATNAAPMIGFFWWGRGTHLLRFDIEHTAISFVHWQRQHWRWYPTAVTKPNTWH